MRRWASYVAMLAVSVAAYVTLRHFGQGLSAPAGEALPTRGSRHADVLVHVLLALVVVLVTARAIGWMFRRLQQPPVVGEILAGILLGPSLLGHYWPDAYHFLLPPEVSPFLGVLSQVGVILYMFLVGLELDPAMLRRRGSATLMVSHASIVVPFLLGAGLALFIYPKVSTAQVSFTAFSLFLGVSMSVTAFPVLARILTDRRMTKSKLGTLALACAAIDDVTAWCLLAFVVSVVQARGSDAWRTPLYAAGYIAVMFLVVRPAMQRLSLFYGQRGRLTQSVMALVFMALLASALVSDAIGIHAVFGAFLLGTLVPHNSGLAAELTDRLEDLVVVLLLPAFFAFTGMKTEIGKLSSAQDWLMCGLIIVVASAGKFGGSTIAAWLSGMTWRESSALGVLMNTRGLMELVVLNIGLELGVISPVLFAMLVIMAVVTTLATTPVLVAILRNAPPDTEPAKPTVVPVPRGGGVLVPVSNPAGVSILVDLALAATRSEDPPPRLLALVRSSAERVGLAERRPTPPVLTAALDHLRAQGKTASVDAHARWTEDPVEDIVGATREPNIGWVLLGFHRPVFGSDLLGGVVKDVLERVRGVAVGVVVHGHDRPLERIFAVVDSGRHGRAVIDLASRLAAAAQAELHAVLIPKEGSDPEPELRILLDEAEKRVGRWLYTDLLAERNPAQLAWKTQGELVVIGVDRADELGLPLDEVAGGERCVVIVQGPA
jgi:Kef-type K+ transport system membrane component KefB